MSGVAFLPDVWYHLAVVVHATDMVLFVNGARRSRHTLPMHIGDIDRPGDHLFAGARYMIPISAGTLVNGVCYHKSYAWLCDRFVASRCLQLDCVVYDMNLQKRTTRTIKAVCCDLKFHALAIIRRHESMCSASALVGCFSVYCKTLVSPAASLENICSSCTM